MPNYVRNRITMKGIASAPLFTEDGDFDFGKVIPMPESLNIVSGSMENDAIEAVLHAVNGNDYIPICGTQHTKEMFMEIIESRGKDLQKLMEQGMLYIENAVKYGHRTWYGWSIENWGTKWNALDTWIANEDSIVFDTAWSAPIPIVRKLAEMFPDERIEMLFADEDTGCNTGLVVFDHGKEHVAYFDNCSQAAYDAYVDLWGESDCLDKDEFGNWYAKDCAKCGLC